MSCWPQAPCAACCPTEPAQIGLSTPSAPSAWSGLGQKTGGLGHDPAQIVDLLAGSTRLGLAEFELKPNHLAERPGADEVSCMLERAFRVGRRQRQQLARDGRGAGAQHTLLPLERGQAMLLRLEPCVRQGI